MWEEKYAVVENGSMPKSTTDDPEWGAEINKKITYFGITPLAAIGITLNIIVINTWRKYSTQFHAAIFVFQSLAVADIVFMGGFCLWYNSPEESVRKVIFRLVTFSTRNILVNFIFLMTLIRWVAVNFPFKFRSWASKFHVWLALGIIITYSGILETSDIVLRSVNVSKYVRVLTEVISDQINLSIPLLAQFALSIHIVWLTWNLSRKVKSGWICRLAAVGQPSMSKRKMSAKLAVGRNRRLTAIIVSIDLLTFLAYPVGVTIVTYFKMTQTKGSFKRFVYACIDLMHVFHASVNFFIYFSLMPEFRRIFWLLRCPRRKGVSPEVHPKLKVTLVQDYPKRNATVVTDKEPVAALTLRSGTEDFDNSTSTFATPPEWIAEYYN